MSESNVMDVFLSVKVDQSRSDDLAGLLDTLQKISSLQSAIKAGASGGMTVKMDTKKIEDKVDNIKKTIETGATGGLIRSVKRDTEYIISRLWSVYSPEASQEQMIDRYLGLGANKNAIVTNFMKSVKDPSILESRWPGGEGKEKLGKIVDVVAGKITRDIAGGVFNERTRRAIQVIERVILGAGDVSAVTIDNLIGLATGREEDFQSKVTRMRRGKKKTVGGVSVGSQVGFAGLVHSKEYDEAFSKIMDDREAFTFDTATREKIVNAMLRGISRKAMRDLVDTSLAGFDPAKNFIPAGELMTPQMKDEILKRVKRHSSDAIRNERKMWGQKYQSRLRPDEYLQLNAGMLGGYQADPDKFKDDLLVDLKGIYRDENYAKLVADDFMTALEANKDKIGDMDYFSIIQQWKRMGKYIDKEDTSKDYGIDMFRVFLKSATGENALMGDSPVTAEEAEKLRERLMNNRNDEVMSLNRSLNILVNDISKTITDSEVLKELRDKLQLAIDKQDESLAKLETIEENTD